MYIVPEEAFTRHFWERVQKSPDPLGCWVWAGPVNNRGYGTVTRNRRHYLAHRWVYEHLIGPIPPGLLVCHTCDNRACVNPAHLFAGTQTDNMRDMMQKGRHADQRRADVHPIGEAHPRAKLTEADVREIRALFAAGLSCQQIAARFPVSRMNITQIVYRRSWQHVK